MCNLFKKGITRSDIFPKAIKLFLSVKCVLANRHWRTTNEPRGGILQKKEQPFDCSFHIL